MAHEGWSPTHSGTHSSLKVDLEFVLLRDARVLRVCLSVCVQVLIKYIHLSFSFRLLTYVHVCVYVSVCVRLSVENISVFLCMYIYIYI